MGYDELYVVEVGVEVLNQEVGLFEVSTLVIGGPIGKIGVDIDENDR